MAETTSMMRETLNELDARLRTGSRRWWSLCRIPSTAASGFPPEEVRRSAQAVSQSLRSAGVEHMEVLEIPGVAYCLLWPVVDDLREAGCRRDDHVTRKPAKPQHQARPWPCLPVHGRDRAGNHATLASRAFDLDV
jgi:hypothetical protein